MKKELISGKKAPYICTPLVGKDKEEIMKELERILPQEPDLLEWRADFYEEIEDVASVLATAEEISAVGNLPILFTIRSEKEGGEKIPLTEDSKVNLLSEMCKIAAVDYIDFEVSNDPEHIKKLREVSKENGKKLVLSYHNFDFTPHNSEIMKRLFMAEFYGADVAKAAVMPQSKEDVLRLLTLTKEADEGLSIPLITMSMGSLGGLSRIVGWTYGSIVTFGLGVQSSAPGQIPIKKLKQMIELTQETVGDW